MTASDMGNAAPTNWPLISVSAVAPKPPAGRSVQHIPTADQNAVVFDQCGGRSSETHSAIESTPSNCRPKESAGRHKSR